MEIKVHGTYLDTMQTINEYVDADFFTNLDRELDIYELSIDGTLVNELIKLGYAGIDSFITSYENDDLEQDLIVYMACLDHGLACGADEMVNYVHSKFVSYESFEDDFFKGRFAQEKADDYIDSIAQNNKELIAQITAYFNYAQYEKDLFLSSHCFIESNKHQFIFLN